MHARQIRQQPGCLSTRGHRAERCLPACQPVTGLLRGQVQRLAGRAPAVGTLPTVMPPALQPNWTNRRLNLGACVATALRAAADTQDSGSPAAAPGAPVPSWPTSTPPPTALAPRPATPTTPPAHALPGCDHAVPARAPEALHPVASTVIRSHPGGRRSSPWLPPTRRVLPDTGGSLPMIRQPYPATPAYRKLFSPYNLRSHPDLDRVLTTSRDTPTIATGCRGKDGQHHDNRHGSSLTVVPGMQALMDSMQDHPAYGHQQGNNEDGNQYEKCWATKGPIHQLQCLWPVGERRPLSRRRLADHRVPI